MALALDLLRELLTKLFFLHLLLDLLLDLLRGGMGEDFLVRTEFGSGLAAVHFTPADEFLHRLQVPGLQ